MTLDSSLIQRAVPTGSMRYYAWLFTASEHKEVFAALMVLERELQDSAEAVHEVAHVRLQWWRDELDRLIAGKAQHPATQVLQQQRTPHSDFSLLRSLQLSAAQQLARSTFDTVSEAQQYLQHSLGNWAQLANSLMSTTTSATALQAANQLGQFIRQVEIWRDLRHDFHHGRLYLPLNELDQLGVEYDTLQQVAWPTTLIEWLRNEMQQQAAAYQHLQASLLDSERKPLRPLLVLAALHAKLLDELMQDPQTLTRHRHELSPFKKLWTAWRTARRAG